MSFLKRLFGSSEEAELKKLNKIVDQVNALEPTMKKKTDAQLRDVTADLKSRVAGGETLDDVLPEAFAAVREAMWRTLGKRHFDVQILGGIVLHQGRIAQMRTGEGKTYTAALAAYLNTLNGNSVHIVTVNDYLAKFQGEEMGKVYKFLGLTVGIILHSDDPRDHAAQYACDVVYGTNNEFGFDYLRDNMAVRAENRVQRSLDFAIVDEVDSILIDEARTPLIISGQGDQSTDLYQAADKFVRTLRSDDYEVDEKKKTVILLESGVAKAERHFGVENLSDMENTTLNHHINQALKAHVTMHRDTDYVIKDGEVIIVDEFTGRLMVGRRYSDGLHQAIEAKEGVDVRNESRTLATITFQNYFRMYKKLSGMTGTAKTEEEEFRGIYALDVVCVPTNKPMIRQDLPDRIFLNQEGKFRHVVEEIERVHKTGQPVLVGTVSVEKSEMLSLMLRRKGVPHVVLNAKMHEREAEIVAQAGKVGAVTIATNMAGRGTDILLGGNPEFLARKQMRADGYDEEMIDQAQSFSETLSDEAKAAREVYRAHLKQFAVQTDKEHEQVVALGGLYIIGTERHEARRIDDQLRGRAGRQGDPGMSVFYISLEDDLLRLFGSDRIMPMIERMGLGPDDMIDAKLLSKQIENAQKRVESRNYDIRRHVLQYDDVMNRQREIIYAQRRQVLEGSSVRDDILKMLDDLIAGAVDTYCPKDQLPELWDFAGLNTYLGRFFLPENYFNYNEKELIDLSRGDLIAQLADAGKEAYAAREQDAFTNGVDMRQVERILLLRVVDDKWMNHIDNMDQLRRGIGLRAVGQRDPVREYQFEGFDMFEEMVQSIRETTVQMLLHVSFQRTIEPPVQRPIITNATHGDQAAPKAPKRAAAAKKIGRNDPCPCGSGKKYKNCCGRNVQ